MLGSRSRDHKPVWTEQDLSDPHATSDKATRVQRMFAAIARSYDLNNRVHSFGRDRAWRRAAVEMAEPAQGEVVLDVACGTGDLALAFAAALRQGSQREAPPRVLGVDFTYEMLPIGAAKASGAEVAFAAGDALHLPLADASVDIVSIAFGIRNVADPAAALREFRRVLRPGGRLIILEFSHPTNPVIRWLDRIYRERVMPRTATWIARDRSGAYRYLPQSVNTFLDRDGMTSLMREAGFGEIRQRPLTFGVAVCYRGVVPDASGAM